MEDENENRNSIFPKNYFHLVPYIGLATGPFIAIYGNMETFPLLTSLFLISIFKRGLNPEPGDYAHPSDQKLDATCTRHAIGKAIVDGFMKRIFSSNQLDFDQKKVIDEVMAIFPDKNPRHPTDFDKKTITAEDKETKKKFAIELHIGKLDGYDKMKEDMKDPNTQEFTYLMVYSIVGFLNWFFSVPPHCVYVRHLIPDDPNNPCQVYCVNSHADNPYFGHPLDKPGNVFYKVTCKAEEVGE